MTVIQCNDVRFLLSRRPSSLPSELRGLVIDHVHECAHCEEYAAMRKARPGRLGRRYELAHLKNRRTV